MTLGLSKLTKHCICVSGTGLPTYRRSSGIRIPLDKIAVLTGKLYTIIPQWDTTLPQAPPFPGFRPQISRYFPIQSWQLYSGRGKENRLLPGRPARLAHIPPSVSADDLTRTLAYTFPERAIIMLSSFLVNIPKHTYPTFQSCINVLPSSDVAKGKTGPAANVHSPAAETAVIA